MGFICDNKCGILCYEGTKLNGNVSWYCMAVVFLSLATFSGQSTTVLLFWNISGAPKLGKDSWCMKAEGRASTKVQPGVLITDLKSPPRDLVSRQLTTSHFVGRPGKHSALPWHSALLSLSSLLAFFLERCLLPVLLPSCLLSRKNSTHSFTPYTSDSPQLSCDSCVCHLKPQWSE